MLEQANNYIINKFWTKSDPKHIQPICPECSQLEHSDSGKNNSIQFDSIHADESIFRFDSIRFVSTI